MLEGRGVSEKTWDWLYNTILTDEALIYTKLVDVYIECKSDLVAKFQDDVKNTTCLK